MKLHDSYAAVGAVHNDSVLYNLSQTNFDLMLDDTKESKFVEREAGIDTDPLDEYDDACEDDAFNNLYSIMHGDS